MSISLDLEENSLFKESKDEKILLKQMLVLVTKLLIIIWKLCFPKRTDEEENCWHISF